MTTPTPHARLQALRHSSPAVRLNDRDRRSRSASPPTASDPPSRSKALTSTTHGSPEPVQQSLRIKLLAQTEQVTGSSAALFLCRVRQPHFET